MIDLDSPLHQRLVDALYTDSMVLADEARCYFDEGGRLDREALAPMARVTFSCESLKVTTRLMHIIAWLLTQRAVVAGEITALDARVPTHRLGEAPDSDDIVIANLPPVARGLIDASIDLYRRAQRLDDTQGEASLLSPARAMQNRLAIAF